MATKWLGCGTAVAVGLLAGVTGVAEGALARSSGSGGYSASLGKGKAFRRQQLIADPATPTGAPGAGSTSVNYDPTVVSLSGLSAGPGYSVSGKVLVAQTQGSSGEVSFLEDFNTFLATPNEVQLGYVQVTYERDSVGTPGQMPFNPGFAQIDVDGVTGFDTHSLVFDYLPGVPDATVTSYKVYAADADPMLANQADFLTGFDKNGMPFTLGVGQLSAANVSGSLDTPAIPLPPGVWAGAVGLTTVAGSGLLRRWKVR